MYDSVQFKGKENLIKAYEARNVEAWGIWQKKSLITKGMGTDQLSEFLDMLAENGSATIYTLKIFEDIDELRKIKENTPADGSITFRLYDYNEQPGTLDRSVAMYERTNARNKLFERLDAIEAKLNGVEEPDEDESLGDKIIGIISDPQQLREYMGIIKDIFGNNNNPTIQPSFRPAGSIGNSEPMSNTPKAQPTDQDLQRLSNALDILGHHDPKVIEHLEKLAKLSQEKPQKFKSLLTMLETFL